MQKILLLGAAGMLGTALVKEASLRNDFALCPADITDTEIKLDITDSVALQKIIEKTKPDIVINCVAIIDHKLCDSDPGLAYRVNARPSAILAQMANTYGFKLVYISTDGYFHGDKDKKHPESAPVTLLNEYARTKYCGEVFTQSAKKHLVIRTNIIGFKKAGGATFAQWVINSLQKQEKMTLFEDYYTSSITVSRFAPALFDLLLKDAQGLLNLAAGEAFSKADFIRAVAAEFNLSTANTASGKVAQLESKRADSLGLDVTKAQNILNYPLPSLKEVVKKLKEDYHETR